MLNEDNVCIFNYFVEADKVIYKHPNLNKFFEGLWMIITNLYHEIV